ncbi:MAG: hypothetical protein ACOZE5_13390 [Verrucomicrobiota bacterium]
MPLRRLIALLMLLVSADAAVRYDMTKAELLQELGRPASVLMKGGREILIFPGNVRIELEHGKVVSVKGLDLAAAAGEATANPPPASAEPPAAPAGPDGEAEPKLTPEEQKRLAEEEVRMEKARAGADAKARAEMEKAIASLENPGQGAAMPLPPSFALGDFLVELVVKWLLMLAALKLTCKYWNADVDWKGLMIATSADTGVRAVVLGIGEGLMGMISVFSADEALAAIVLLLVLRKVSTNQSLQQAATITLTSKVFSIVVGSFLSVAILRALP